MSRGGARKGAGRKPEYHEPIVKFLVGLPESVMQQLDDYAAQHKLSRPKAIALLLQQVQNQHGTIQDYPTTQLLQELKLLKAEIASNILAHRS